MEISENAIELATIYIVGVASTTLDDEHLLISSFLKVQLESNRKMSAIKHSIKEKFKELMSARNGEYLKGSFKKTLIKLLYTSYSLKLNTTLDEFQRRPFDEQFTFKTIFELRTRKNKPIEEMSVFEVIDDDDNILVQIEDPFYTIIKKYENELNYEKCLDECRKHYQANTKLTNSNL